MTEEKIRFQMRISQDTDHRVKSAMPLANCKSQNEFVEDALRFYCAYLTDRDNVNYLAPILSSMVTGVVHDSENRIARLLFKLTVELSMMMHIIAAGLEVNEDALDDLRTQCIWEVRGTNGSISFDKAVHRYQEGGI